MLPNTSAPLTHSNWVVVVAGPSVSILRGGVDSEGGEGGGEGEDEGREEEVRNRKRREYETLAVATEVARSTLSRWFGEERVVVYHPLPLTEGVWMACALFS